MTDRGTREGGHSTVVLARHVQSGTERMILVRQGQNDRERQ